MMMCNGILGFPLLGLIFRNIQLLRVVPILSLQPIHLVAHGSDEVVVCDQNQQPILGVSGMDLWVSDSLNYISFYWMQSGGSPNSSPYHFATYAGLYSVQTQDVSVVNTTLRKCLFVMNFEPNIVVFNDVIYTTDSLGYYMQWNLNGDPIASANGSVILMSEIGSYSLTLLINTDAPMNLKLSLTMELDLDKSALFVSNPAISFLK